MQSLDMLTINEEPRSKEGLMEVVGKAFAYFPEGLWRDINYVGNINVTLDLTIKSKERVYGAFIFVNLVRRVRETKKVLKTEDLLLAVTNEPVIVTYHRFELDKFKRITSLVRDYVSNDVGVISLFETEESERTKIAAHGLGHNQGLEHHAEPVDLMYARLLDGYSIEIDGFCQKCRRKLRKKRAV